LKALKWRTPYQVICEAWTKAPAIFKINPHHLNPGPHSYAHRRHDLHRRRFRHAAEHRCLALRPRTRSDIGIDDRRMTMADFQDSLSLLTD